MTRAGDKSGSTASAQNTNLTTDLFFDAKTDFPSMGLFDGTALERPVLCERCEKDIKTCDCEPLEEAKDEPAVEPSKQRLRVRSEKRKRGKMVTVVSGLKGPERQRQELLTQLKNYCGAGGTLNDDQQIEIQGEQAERLKAKLEQLGYRVS